MEKTNYAGGSREENYITWDKLYGMLYRDLVKFNENERDLKGRQIILKNIIERIRPPL